MMLLIGAIILIILTVATCEAVVGYRSKSATKESGWRLGFYVGLWSQVVFGTIAKLLF